MWELDDSFISSSNSFQLEPFNTWNENFVFWLSRYLFVKCEEQSKRFVSEKDLPKILSIQSSIIECNDIEKIGDLVNELARLKFKSIKTYYNNVYPIFYFLLERDAYSIKNITTNLLSNYFSFTKEKEEQLKDKIKNAEKTRNIKKIYELSYASKMNRLTILINFIKYIEDSNIDSENELGYIFDIKRKEILKQIKKEKRVLSVLTPSEGFQRFFSAIENVPYKDSLKDRNILMLKLLMYLGIRVSELIYLKNDDITIENDNVKFNIIGKGNKQRILYVKYSHIKADMDRYEKIRVNSDENFYFTTPKGKQVNDRYINTLISNTLKLSGIEVSKMSSPHMIRHSLASYLKHTLKMDNVSISKWLGHEDLKTTMIYLHFTEQEIIEMADNIKKLD